MKTLAPLLVTCGILMACGGQDSTTTSPNLPTPLTPAQALPTYTVFGIVRDEAGVPLRGASAEVASVSFRGIAVTNEAGYFQFPGVRSQASIRVWADSYEIYTRDTVVASNVVLDIKLTKAQFGDTLVLGRTIRSFVSANAPPCDPVGWDARAPCRRFTFTPQTSGQLFVSIIWFGGPELDATITTREGVYVAISNGLGDGKITVSAAVAAGQAYEVRVSSYYEYQIFDLKADLNR